jgi:DNA-binding HxlR family transcriptional regulator
MKSYGQLCAVARALDVLGDRWTLLVVRELLIRGQARFTDLQSGLPGIAPNLLTQRLRDLETHEVLTKQAATPPAAGTVYSLTERGHALEGVLRELLRWGAPTVPDAPADAAFQMHWLSQPARYLLRDQRPDDGPVVIRFGDARDGFDVTVEDGAVHTGPCHPRARPSATVSGPGPALVALVQGGLSLGGATDAAVTITGDLEALRRVLPPPLES